MHSMMRLLVAAALVVVSGTLAIAQDTFEFNTDFTAGQVYPYRLTATSTVPGVGEASKTEVEFSYEIVLADAYGFTVGTRVRKIEITSPQGTILYTVENPGNAPLYLTALARTLEAIQVTYDREWNLVQIDGFGRLAGEILRRTGDLGEKIGGTLSPIVDRVLGPLATAIARSSSDEELTRVLFTQGSVSIGQNWETKRDLAIFGTATERVEVQGFGAEHGRPVCRIGTTQTMEYGPIVGLLGTKSQETTGTTSVFANGLPASAKLSTTIELARPEGTRVTGSIEITLLDNATGTGAANNGEEPEAEDWKTAVENALEARDIDKALKLIEKATSDDPKNAEAWLLLAQVDQFRAQEAFKDGTTPEAAELMVSSARSLRQYISLIGDAESKATAEFAQTVYYNEACGYAVKGDADKAVLALGDAVKAGWTDVDHLEKDSDLDSLRAREDFQALVKSIPERAADHARTEAKETIEKGETFAFDFALTDLGGKSIRLSDYAGKVLIVDVWGTWCPPCRREIPHFIELHKKYQDAGLEIVGLNYEGVPETEAAKKIAEFVETNGIPYACLIGDEATRDQIPDFEGYPTTLFIDRAGKVRAKIVGYHDLATLDGIVKSLLEEQN